MLHVHYQINFCSPLQDQANQNSYDLKHFQVARVNSEAKHVLSLNAFPWR